MTILMITSNFRSEEKMLLAALEAARCPHDVIDIRQKVFDRRNEALPERLVLFNRCISQVQSLATTRYYESFGVPCVNSSFTVSTCGDKQATTLLLQAAGLAVPETVFALGRDSALRAIEELEPPVVIKPVVGSWGRMVVRANDIESAISIIELRENMPGPQHRLHYIQKFVETGNRDIRAIAIDGELVTAYARVSDNWITNAARGATGQPIPLTPELQDMCWHASKALGGGILSFDFFETERDGYLLNEVNHTTEFALAKKVTNVDVASAFVGFLQRKSEQWYQ